MNAQAQTFATQYLTREAGLFWRWAPEGDAVLWLESGRTIIFRRELEALLKEQRHRRLPRLSAVLLLLAACREQWPPELEPGGDLHQRVLQYQVSGMASAEQLQNLLDAVLVGLKQVHQCAARQPMQFHDKLVLLDMVFGPQPTTAADHTDSQMLRKALGEGLSFDPTHPPEERGSPGVFELNQTLVALRTGLRGFDASAFDLRRKTGVDQLITSAPVEEKDLDLPPAEAGRRLIQQLRDDQALSSVAALATRLLAAVALPRPVSSPDDTPLGGVSDITNRGTPDRLLISELANDDLTLATRIALNEALYLRRESPPAPPVTRREVLIDTGLRMWGVPRVFAAATALALQASADTRADVQMFRSTDEGLEAADFATRAGLLEHLGSLSAHDVPQQAVELFWKQNIAPTPDEATQHVLITHRDALAAPEMRDLLSPPAGRLLYVATVSEDGDFSIWSFSRVGRRKIASARFDLEQLLAEPEQSAATADRQALIDQGLDPQLPVIFSMRPFPLRVPHPATLSRTAIHPEHGVVSLVKDGRLLHWVQRGFGPLQVTDRMSGGKPLWLHVDGSARFRTLTSAELQGRLPLTTVDLKSGDTSRVLLAPNRNRPLSVFAHGGAIMLSYRQSVEVFGIESGERLAVLALPRGVRPAHGRFFTNDDEWYAMSFDGRSARLDRIELDNRGGTFERGRILAMFDRRGMDGPWALTHKGWLMGLGPSRELRFTLPITWPPMLRGVSQDGHRLHLAQLVNQRPRNDVVLDLQANTFTPFTAATLEPRMGRIVQERSLLKQVEAIVCTPAHLCLLKTYDNKGQTPVARAPLSGSTLEWSSDPGKAVLRTQACSFGPRFTVDHLGIQLRRATWADGSEALLDSRGLLHLKSSDENVSQVTLVLDSALGQVSGWTSSGLRVGDSYYHGRNARDEPAQLAAIIERFARRLRTS